MQVRVELNGTAINPYHAFGLTQNPFPQTASAELDGACLRMQSLGGEPIPNVDYIREKLRGFSDEFVELCCVFFKPGEYVTFHVSWG